MNRKFALLAIPVLALAACTERGYKATPIESKDDRTNTSTPELQDKEALRDQECFEIQVYAHGWNYSRESVGVACIVDSDIDGKEYHG